MRPVLLLPSLAAGVLLVGLASCETGPGSQCDGDSGLVCKPEEVCQRSGDGFECVPNCSLGTRCPLGEQCESVTRGSERYGLCRPIPCSEDPAACPAGTTCWPPPVPTDTAASRCRVLPPCGGLDESAPVCADGRCGDGLTCAQVNASGETETQCGCVPEQ